MTGSVEARSRSWGRVLAVSLALLVALGSWGLLVLGAIDAGGRARGGDSSGWAWLAVSALGAVACLFLALLLAQRLAREWRGERRPAYVGTHRR